MSAQLQSVCSVIICQLGSSLLAQSVCDVSVHLSSAAIRRLSFNLSIQLSGQLQLSAELRPVRREEFCHLSCNVLAEL